MEKQLENRLNDEGYKNWLKVTQALIHSKEALHDFTRNVIEKIHGDILTRTGLGRCDGTCNTNKGKKPSCTNCSKWVKEIKSYYKGIINWKNTEPTKWHDTPWEIAKCFMNPQGSKATAASNTGPEKTDLSGILNVLVNCKEFGRNYLNNKGHPEKVREVRNGVMHCPTMAFSEDEMKRHVDIIIALLEDGKCLKNLESCKETVRMIKSIRDGEFKICAETEVDCIGLILRAHELLLESEEEVGDETRQSLESLSKLIKTNKDLENKFDLKLKDITDRMNDMTDHFNSRMSLVEFSCGDLKGKIERVEARIAELEKNRGVEDSEVERPRVRQYDKSLFKNWLQCFAQKKGFDVPKYSHRTTDSGKFLSTVSVAGRKFDSEEPKSSKKEADQCAAEMALKFFTNEVTDYDKDNDTSSPPEKKALVLPKVQKEKNISYKNQLQELAQERKIRLPLYATKQKESGVFVSEVLFDGAWYSPDVVPQGKKIDAEQKAAQFVLSYLEDTAKSVTETSAFPSRQSIGNFPSSSEVSTPIAKQTSSKNNVKTFKSILNEYVQKCTGDNKAPDFKFSKLEGKFVCSVTISGQTYQSRSPKNSKTEAKENAAMEACSKLNLSQNVASESDLPLESIDSNRSSLPIRDKSIDLNTPSASSVSTDEDGRSCVDSSKVSGSAAIDRPDGKKTFKSKLNEYAQSLGSGVRPSYEDIKCESGFRSKVTILDKTYEGKTPQNSKKEAKEMAAREAWYRLNPSAVSTTESLTSSLDKDLARLSLSNDVSGSGKDVLPTNDGSIDLDKSRTSRTNGSEAAVDFLVSKNFSTSTEDRVTSTVVVEGLSDVVNTSPTNVNGEVKEEIFNQDEEDATSNKAITTNIPETGGKATGAQKPSAQEKEKKNFKGVLQQLVKQSKIDPRYVTKRFEGTKEFFSKVFLDKRCFKGEKAKKKRDAEQNAAKVALDELRGVIVQSANRCTKVLAEYHEELKVGANFPNYGVETRTEGGKFSIVVTVVKKWEVTVNESLPKKRDVEEALAKQAVQLLGEEKKTIQNTKSGNYRSRLNQFCQMQRNVPELAYNVDGDQASFSGSLCFYTVEEYESLSPQLSKDEATARAAKSACNDLGLI